MSKRTPWFTASVKPVRDGWYEWRCVLEYPMQIEWRHARFKFPDGSELSPCRNCQWRGLTRPAEEA